MHKLALILVIIGTVLVALDLILGYYGRARTNTGRVAPFIGILHVGVILIGIGVMLGVKPIST